ncbi:MAG TPA: tetratricopeptide repeat protein [Blastocatellia bacterium]|nr:tetratricopeptide repeat protein [Blastocatellia bacterium]
MTGLDNQRSLLSMMTSPKKTVAWLCIVLAIALWVTALDAVAQTDPILERLQRAASLIGQNKLEQAESELKAVLKVSPDDASALDLLGTIKARQGDLDQAESLFARAVAKDGRHIGAHMNLAYLYLLKRAPDRSAAELNEVLRLDPSNADASFKLGWLLYSQGKYDECIKLVAQARQSQAISPPLIAILGDAQFKKGNLEQAETAYLESLAALGANPDALLGLSMVYKARNDTKSFAAYMNRASALINGSPDRLYRFAVIASESPLADQAPIALKRAIELRPNEPTYYFLLGICWLQKPDVHEAEQAFREFLRLMPESPQGQLHLGYALLKQKRYPEAREWLEKSFSKQPAIAETFYYLGLIAQEENEDSKAVELFQKSINLSNDFAFAHVALGSSYLKLKDYARARQELEIGAKLNPNDTKVHYTLALLYARLKEPARAQEEMQIVERLKKVNGQDAAEVTPAPPRP